MSAFHEVDLNTPDTPQVPGRRPSSPEIFSGYALRHDQGGQLPPLPVIERRVEKPKVSKKWLYIFCGFIVIGAIALIVTVTVLMVRGGDKAVDEKKEGQTASESKTANPTGSDVSRATSTTTANAITTTTSVVPTMTVSKSVLATTELLATSTSMLGTTRFPITGIENSDPISLSVSSAQTLSSEYEDSSKLPSGPMFFTSTLAVYSIPETSSTVHEETAVTLWPTTT